MFCASFVVEKVAQNQNTRVKYKQLESPYKRFEKSKLWIRF